jgi:hypothetical protein
MQVMCSAISFDTAYFALALYVVVDQGRHLLSK